VAEEPPHRGFNLSILNISIPGILRVLRVFSTARMVLRVAIVMLAIYLIRTTFQSQAWPYRSKIHQMLYLMSSGCHMTPRLGSIPVATCTVDGVLAAAMWIRASLFPYPFAE